MTVAVAVAVGAGVAGILTQGLDRTVGRLAALLIGVALGGCIVVWTVGKRRRWVAREILTGASWAAAGLVRSSSGDIADALAQWSLPKRPYNVLLRIEGNKLEILPGEGRLRGGVPVVVALTPHPQISVSPAMPAGLVKRQAVTLSCAAGELDFETLSPSGAFPVGGS